MDAEAISTQTASSKSLFCEACNITSTSKICYDQHIAGQKHKKNLEKLSLIKNEAIKLDQRNTTNNNDVSLDLKTNPTDSNEAKKENVTTKKTFATQAINCDICNLSLSSMIVYEQHINGQKHKKKLQQNELNQQSSELEQPAMSPLLFCTICDIKMTNKDQMNIHLAGKNHKKKLIKIEAGTENEEEMYKNYSIDWDNFKIPNEYKNETNEKFEFVCMLCNKYLQGRIQLVMHLKSKKHHNKISGKSSERWTKEQVEEFKQKKLLKKYGYSVPPKKTPSPQTQPIKTLQFRNFVKGGELTQTSVDNTNEQTSCGNEGNSINNVNNSLKRHFDNDHNTHNPKKYITEQSSHYSNNQSNVVSYPFNQYTVNSDYGYGTQSEMQQQNTLKQHDNFQWCSTVMQHTSYYSQQQNHQQQSQQQQVFNSQNYSFNNY